MLDPQTMTDVVTVPGMQALRDGRPCKRCAQMTRPLGCPSGDDALRLSLDGKVLLNIHLKCLAELLEGLIQKESEGQD